MSESLLVERIRGGDTTAFDEVVRRFQQRLIQFVFRLVGDRDEAADVAQETFIKAYERFADFRGDAGVFTWLYRIAYNESVSLLRRRKLRSFLRLESDGTAPEGPHSDALTATDDPSLDLEGQQLRDLVADALATLPSRQRAVFTMRHYEAMSHVEIARVIGRSEGAVRASYFHAVRKLREQLTRSGLIEST